MSVLDDFYIAHFHYSVALRLWMDTCRQLATCKGSLAERQALVDETVRLGYAVGDMVDDVESLIPDTLEYIQSSDNADPDILDAISLVTNNLKEDRARADDYVKYVSRRRVEGTEKQPRKPQIANPFDFGEVQEEVEEEEEGVEDIPQETTDPPEEEVNPLVQESENLIEEQKE